MDWLGDLGRDVRHAARGLRRNPGFAATVALILALGLGANTAMFSIVYGVLIRPLPYPNAAEIVRIGESLAASGGSGTWLSNRSMPLLEESAESFEQLAGYQEISARSASLDGATLSGAQVSPSLFPLLGSRPELGRLFLEAEARDGANRVVVLSHGVWTRRFGSDADIVGTIVDLDGEPHTVVGVLPEGFDFPNPDNDFWTPLVIPPFAPPSTDGSAVPGTVVTLVFGALGRLRQAYRQSRPPRKRAPFCRRAAPVSWREPARIRHPVTVPRSMSVLFRYWRTWSASTDPRCWC